MPRSRAIFQALKSTGRYVPQNSGMGRLNPEMYFQQNAYQNMPGNFLPRPSSLFTDGAFAPSPPIQPTPVDQPPEGGQYPDPRWWQYRVGWNLPTQPGTEGLKLASFDQLRTLSQKYSVARACIDLREEEIRALEWDIVLTSDAAKAYQGDRKSLRDFGERRAKAKRFFRRPDPDFWNFDTFLNAFLEEIFVYDALAMVFRPKYGAAFGMGGRGLLGSNLDSLNLVSGPTIRPLLDLHGGHPRPPAPAYQQYLFGVPRSDYMTIQTGADIEEAGLAGAEVNQFSADIMLYAPYWRTRESPYGFPPVERALLPIISGLQKQEFQLDYFTEGTTPSVYISPGDPNITPTQIGELQNALNAIAGDPSYHLKTIVLPPGSKVEPQRPVDLSDSFDFLIMNQVCMAFDVNPVELGITPDVGATQQGPSASGFRFQGEQKRDIKSRTSAKPMLKWICDIFNYVLHDICDQHDMQFQFEGLVDDEDKQAITQLGVDQIQNGVASVDEIRERLDLPPWGLEETSGPVVFTQNGPVPFSMAPQLIQAALNPQGAAPSSSSSSSGKKTSKKPSAKRGTSATKPNGSHSAPVVQSSRAKPATPGHEAAQASLDIQRPQRGTTGGSPGRSPVAGSRKRGDARTPTDGRTRNKAIASELDSLKRHIRKGRLISTWNPEHIDNRILGMIAEDTAKGVLLDIAVDRALAFALLKSQDEDTQTRQWWTSEEPHVLSLGGDGDGSFDFDPGEDDDDDDEEDDGAAPGEKNVVCDLSKAAQFPGWEHDLGLVGAYTEIISQAFHDAETAGATLRKEAASGQLPVSSNVLLGLISDKVSEIFTLVMNNMWMKAWNLGYEAAGALLGKRADPANAKYAMLGFLDTEGVHWLDQVARTGLGNNNVRSEMIARTEVARAMNAGVFQCYKDSGVSHKHLLVSPDDTCDVCANAKSIGIIPLDAPFPNGGMGGPFHPQCRCIPAPAGVDVEPPQAHIRKTMVHPYSPDPGSGAGNCRCGHAEGDHSPAKEDNSRLGWILLRAKDRDGKYRFLLQQRSDGSWGMPGGKLHIGEDPWNGAYREVSEELGDLPPLTETRTFHHTEGNIQVYLYMCDTDYFQPKLNGGTPEETQGAAWFRKGEISDLNLTPKFRDDWERSVHLKRNATKTAQNLRNETGEWLTLDDPDRMGATLGSRWPYPHRGDATEWVPHNNRPGGGQADGEMGAAEPPRQATAPHDLSTSPESRIYPRGAEDEAFPQDREPMPAASRFPRPGPDGQYPRGGIASSPGVGAQSVPGGPVKNTNAPIVGAGRPVQLKPYQPREMAPEVWDPAEAGEHMTDDPDSAVVYDLPAADTTKADREGILWRTGVLSRRITSPRWSS